MRSQWNDAEDEALQGLSSEAQVIYLRGFRRYMDYSSGVSGGPRRRLSYKALAELISVDPDWGSRRSRRELPTVGQVRARVAELERAGLVENAGSCRAHGLVFKLPLADTGSVRLKKERHDEQHDEQHKSSVVKFPKCIENTGSGQQGSNTGSDARTNTHQEYSTELNSTAGQLPETWPDHFKPQSPSDWGSFLARYRHWAYHRVASPKLVIMYQRWAQLGLSIGDMRQIIEIAEISLGKAPDGPEWYRNFAETYARERDRLSQEVQSNQQRGTHGGSREDRKHRAGRDERDAVERQLSDCEYGFQNW